ncbi:putative methyl-CpG DNA binding, DNA-binding domain superfamily [Helianthus annuus]|uniref:Methyl-CpG DNA binding, DNA-binding domain superfamily n=1 Tax=Helianthus annuus TaxID=4232 RepID=A0A251VM21_HELAN|nr:methyl-CpG-binding domain-containing protein 7 isoform X2 [Helianthus annuus]KAF5821507.1 putative methyl-CpG DNA binding, DNA-binding domain superfamily [Helianthus annuus]KAJ0622133.1 putative methyl-CpG DNA binding, DNA-binding domain superfamily [Helianthus annuus]KAJ0947438.1 putative methyl-CpG DNA binding, DNA-binding domain superfamily [Helianthus annuus]KAJ0956399.1 putative methyl-CpG DNA binding, DNA-binding domain superfamily [Helianthus annuus]
MAEAVTGGNDSDLHRQLALINDVTPISHSDSDSSPMPFCVPHGWIINRVPRPDGHTMAPESNWTTTKFTLPEDWFVEKVPRKSGNTIDKYYHDPETGRKFRSLKDVERYLIGGSIPTRSKSKRPLYYEKMQDFEEDQDNEYRLINMTTGSFLSTSPFLPEGWIVKEVPRKTGDHFDKYYYEPGTGHMFRSLTSVKKHLAQLEESSPLSVVLEEFREDNVPLSKAFKLASPIKNYRSYDSWKKSTSSNAVPSRINWVIPSTAGETWNAFVGDELVPDSMKQKWGRRFMWTIN